MSRISALTRLWQCYSMVVQCLERLQLWKHLHLSNSYLINKCACFILEQKIVYKPELTATSDIRCHHPSRFSSSYSWHVTIRWIIAAGCWWDSEPLITTAALSAPKYLCVHTLLKIFPLPQETVDFLFYLSSCQQRSGRGQSTGFSCSAKKLVTRFTSSLSFW